MYSGIKTFSTAAIILCFAITGLAGTHVYYHNRALSLNSNNNYLATETIKHVKTFDNITIPDEVSYKVALALGEVTKVSDNKFYIGLRGGHSYKELPDTRGASIALNDKKQFVIVNLGNDGQTIYYNSGKIWYYKGNSDIKFRTKGKTFDGNECSGLPKIALNNNGYFIEVHQGVGKKHFWQKNTHNLYYVIGHINTNNFTPNIKIIGSGKFPFQGIKPNITLNGNEFMEVHLSQNTDKPYTVYGTVNFHDGTLNISKFCGHGQKLSDKSFKDIENIHIVKKTTRGMLKTKYWDATILTLDNNNVLNKFTGTISPENPPNIPQTFSLHDSVSTLPFIDNKGVKHYGEFSTDNAMNGKYIISVINRTGQGTINDKEFYSVQKSNNNNNDKIETL
ncbi:MAG: hypothetical protein K9M56_06825 [Victivallales bacterium]|nr:hypothetical protein [Victivallales bacterium]